MKRQICRDIYEDDLLVIEDRGSKFFGETVKAFYSEVYTHQSRDRDRVTYRLLGNSYFQYMSDTDCHGVAYSRVRRPTRAYDPSQQGDKDDDI